MATISGRGIKMVVSLSQRKGGTSAGADSYIAGKEDQDHDDDDETTKRRQQRWPSRPIHCLAVFDVIIA